MSKPALNSAGESPPRLVCRTVLETFALIRLLRRTILVMDTFLRVNFGRAMYAIMTVQVQRYQVTTAVIPMIFVFMVNLHQVPRPKIQSTVGAFSSLSPEHRRFPWRHPGITPHSSCGRFSCRPVGKLGRFVVGA